MDDHLKGLMQQLGNAINESLSDSESIAEVIGEIKAEKLVVGHDFAFGKGREGTTDWLKHRIETEVIPPFEIGGHRVSSSEIRRSIEAGDVEHLRLEGFDADEQILERLVSGAGDRAEGGTG